MVGCHVFLHFTCQLLDQILLWAISRRSTVLQNGMALEGWRIGQNTVGVSIIQWVPVLQSCTIKNDIITWHKPMFFYCLYKCFVALAVRRDMLMKGDGSWWLKVVNLWRIKDDWPPACCASPRWWPWHFRCTPPVRVELDYRCTPPVWVELDYRCTPPVWVELERCLVTSLHLPSSTRWWVCAFNLRPVLLDPSVFRTHNTSLPRGLVAWFYLT